MMRTARNPSHINARAVMRIKTIVYAIALATLPGFTSFFAPMEGPTRFGL
jgi:hypothetical protein